MSRGAPASARRSRDEYARALFQVAVGRSVRLAREAAGMTQRALCEASGVSMSTLVNVENGATPCPLFVASQIAEAVDCTIDDLAPVMIEEGSDER